MSEAPTRQTIITLHFSDSEMEPVISTLCRLLEVPNGWFSHLALHKSVTRVNLARSSRLRKWRVEVEVAAE